MTGNAPFADCTDGEAAARILAGQGFERVRIGVFDVDAVFREKAVNLAKAEMFLREGSSYSNVLYAWDTAGQTYGGGTFADERIALDPSSGRRYPFAASTAIFIGDFVGPHGDLSARNIAATQIERAASMGFGVRAAFEYEFSVFEETAQSLRDRDYRDLRHAVVGNQPYSAITSAIDDDFISGMVETMAIAGIEVDSFHTELGPGSFEMPLAVADGLRAADNAALFKTFAKAYAQKRSRIVTFMAKWSHDWPGQSGHLHLSLYDLKTGLPAFQGDPADDGVNLTLARFIGGLMRYLPDAVVLSAHTVNAYRRLIPGSWAPTHAGWGVENRSCAIRAITRPGPASRVEYRVPGADSNPYLALAACLGCGLAGLAEGLDPPPPTAGDAYLETVAADRRFPRNLLEAAERFGASVKMRELYGEPFVDWFVSTRIWEDRVFQRHVSDLDVRRYFEVI